jgi:hypothetical protein
LIFPAKNLSKIRNKTVKIILFVTLQVLLELLSSLLSISVSEKAKQWRISVVDSAYPQAECILPSKLSRSAAWVDSMDWRVSR